MKNNRALLFLSCVILAGTTAFAKDTLPTPTYDYTELESRIAKLEHDQSQPSFEFHGYGRSGLLLNADNNLSKGNPFGSSTRTGRLGNESDTYLEAELVKNFYLDNGSWAKWHLMFAHGNSSYNDWVNGTAVRQAYAEMGNLPIFTGAFENSVIWAGKRFYNRRDIHITDYYFTDYSGTGLGIDDVALWGGKLDLAVVAKDLNPITLKGTDANNTVSGLNIVNLLSRYDKGAWEIDLGVSFADENKDRTIFDENINSYMAYDAAGYGAQLGVFYNTPGFYWTEKGFSKVFTQVGYGLNANSGLGSSRGNADGVEDSATVRFGTYGLYPLAEKWDLFTSLIIQHDRNAQNSENPTFRPGGEPFVVEIDGKENTWIGFAVRPVYKVNENFELQFEAGYSHITNENDNGTKVDGNIYKLTFAPTFKLDANNFWARPEIRTFVTWAGWDDGFQENFQKDLATNYGGNNGVNVGVQAEVWF